MTTQKKWSSYKIINLSFIGVIGILFIYSLFYTPGIINCAVKTYTGVECTTCGLTRDFNNILYFRFGEIINVNSVTLFLFFFIQLVTRFGLLLLSFENKKIIIGDIVFSSILFIVTFYPLIKII